MSDCVAKKGDRVVAVDVHVVLIPSPGGAVPTPTPMAFNGALAEDLSSSLFVDGEAAALEGSVAKNAPHIPLGGSFQKPPTNRGSISSGSRTVFADNRPVARANDRATCCNDPSDRETGHVIAFGTVFAG